ncbi:MAG: DJ-1 family glyoxalase III [Clostridia bacterium]
MIYLFLAEGFEEIEALAVVDIIRRAEVSIKTVGVGSDEITGSHGITVKADMQIKDITTDDMEMIILPGGMPGTLNLEHDIIVKTCIRYCIDNDKYICAICAAPSILGHLGLLNGKKAVCFPGFEQELIGAINPDERVCVDGKIITARAAGVTCEFAIKIVENFVSVDEAKKIKASMQIL